MIIVTSDGNQYGSLGDILDKLLSLKLTVVVRPAGGAHMTADGVGGGYVLEVCFEGSDPDEEADAIVGVLNERIPEFVIDDVYVADMDVTNTLPGGYYVDPEQGGY